MIIVMVLNATFNNISNPTKKPGVNSGAPEGYAVPAPLVTPVVLYLVRRLNGIQI
jgi:hypothetical protein